jgi:Tfp pilus assembly protein PilF
VGYLRRDPETPTARRKSSEYFSRAVALSRNSALIWDEWASLFLFVLQQPEEAYTRLECRTNRPKYHRTYALLGEYYLRKATNDNDSANKRDYFKPGCQQPVKSTGVTHTWEPTAKFNYA